MAVNIGPRIGIEGEENYRAQLMKIIETQKALNDEMKKTKSSWDDATTAEEKAADKKRILSEQINKQKERVAQLRVGLKQAERTFGENSTQAMKWKQALYEAETELNNLNRELDLIPTKAQLYGQKLQDFGDKMEKSGDKIKKAGEVMTNVGATLTRYVTAPVLAAGTAAIKLGSDYEENLNKVDSAFKGSSDIVKDWAKEATKNFGMSESAALDATSLFGDMATSMGLSTDEAAAMSTKLAGLAGDMSSFKNIDLQTAMNALKGVFTGETESLKGLGVVMTETNLKAFAEDMGLVYDNMTQAQKVTLRYQYVMKNTANAQGDYLRTSDGFANSMRTLKAETSNLGAAFGRELLPYITPLVKKATELVQSFGNLSEEEKQAIIKTAGLAAAAGPLLVVAGKLTTAVGSVVGEGGKLIKWAGELVAGQTAISSTALAAGAGIGALAALAAAAYFGYKDLEEGVRNSNTELYESIDAVNGTNKALENATGGLVKGMEDAKKAIDDVDASTKAATDIADQIEKLTNKTSLNADEQARLKVLVAEMNQLYPDMGLAIDDVTGALNMSNAEIRDFIDNEYKMAKAQAYTKAMRDSLTAMAEAELAVAKAQMEREALSENYREALQVYDSLSQKYTNSLKDQDEVTRELTESGTQQQAVTQHLKVALNDATQALDEQKQRIDECTAAEEEANKQYELTKAALEPLAASLGMTVDEFLNLGNATGETEVALEDLGEQVEETTSLFDATVTEMQGFYQSTYESAKESLKGQTDMWEELEQTESTTVESMQKGLQSHIDSLKRWNRNVTTLTDSTAYKTDENFRFMVNSLIAAGEDSAPELQALVDEYERADGDLSAITSTFGDWWLLSDLAVQSTSEANTNLKYGLYQTETTFKTSGVPAAAKKMMGDTGDAIKNYDLGEPTKMAVRTIAKAQPEMDNQGKGLIRTGTNAMKSEQPGMEAAAKSAGVGSASNLASGIVSNAYKVANAAANLAGNVSGPITGLDSYTWGSHLVDNMASAMYAKAQSLYNAAKHLAEQIWANLGHSTPKEGPLKDDDIWGLHLAQNFASAMERGVPVVKAAATDLAMAAAIPTHTMMNIDAVSGANAVEALTVDDIYNAFSAAMAENETKIVIGNREFGRILRDQGVA